MISSTPLTLLFSFLLIGGGTAWSTSPLFTSPSAKTNARPKKIHPLRMALGIPIGKNYKPKWKKLETLEDKEGKLSEKDKGITGTVNVVFNSGSQTISTYANPGDPIRDVASQAGQFIKYGCGKGECGTCQALCNGQYIKPCVATVPRDIPEGEQYVLSVKATKSKSASSGKFYSIRSIIMGFWNNVLGMLGMALTRRAAKKNYDERREYEDMIAQKAREKREARLRADRGGN